MKLPIQLFILVTGIILIVFGLINGDALAVLKKARLICLECIGIG